ncbi:MAG: hypothetical protein HC869_08485 [Rhodospirillales bacterium]|nr:hypothetical protein [Rhodospirillales bacterium]
MKTMKLALLGTAALAAVTVSARADDVAALKAQLEALNARVAQLEAAPAVPAGYQLLTITEADSHSTPAHLLDEPAYRNPIKSVTRIGILPTADAPASTVIEWSGFVRAALVYTDFDGAYPGADGVFGTADDFGTGDELDILSRAQIQVVGKTDTAVGEVGVQVRVRGNFDGGGNATAVIPDGTYGWWKMTPELTFSGGYIGSLGNIGYGYDGACTCEYTDNADVSLNPGDVTQLRVTYESGPILAAIAIEDASAFGIGDADADGDQDGTYAGITRPDSLGAAAELKYTGDTFNGEISAVWRDGDTGDDLWAIGLGVGVSLGDMANLSVGTAVGQYFGGEDFWRASALIGFNLSDAVRAELAYGHTENDVSNDVDAVLAGIYYEPVSQLRLGLEGEWIDTGPNDGIVVDFVTRWSF